MSEEVLLTVLFCDLVGSTQLSSQFDPEDWRDIVRAYQQVSASVLQRRGGHIAQYQGDGLLVYFGYSEPNTGHVEQAVEAGLEIVAAVEEVNGQLQQEYGVTLAVRIGVHSGPAVFGTFGEAGHVAQLAVGETPTIAAGIQDYAAPNTVVVSGGMLSSLLETFTWTDVGRQVLKGVADPVQIAQVQVVRVASRHQGVVEGERKKEGLLDEAERRQLTVMFCQLVGVTELAAQLSPEAVLNIVQGYQTTSAEVIGQYDGHIAQYLDTGLLVYFGYPTAHEDDAARSIRAGLEIVTALDQARGQFLQPVQVRIGIHTGPVVVGQMGGGSRHEQLALGETPNLAARVQGKAEPDEVVISAATQRLVAGLFETEDRGRYELKGISTPQSLYRVMAESTAHNRFEVAVQRGLTPLVGRETEVEFLHQRWEQAQSGSGQAVLV